MKSRSLVETYVDWLIDSENETLVQEIAKRVSEEVCKNIEEQLDAWIKFGKCMMCGNKMTEIEQRCLIAQNVWTPLWKQPIEI